MLIVVSQGHAFPGLSPQLIRVHFPDGTASCDAGVEMAPRSEKSTRRRYFSGKPTKSGGVVELLGERWFAESFLLNIGIGFFESRRVCVNFMTPIMGKVFLIQFIIECLFFAEEIVIIIVELWK